MRRQTDERHKAVFEIFTAISKRKWDGPFIVVKTYNLIYNKHLIWRDGVTLSKLAVTVTLSTTSFNIQELYSLFTLCFYVLYMELRKKKAIVALYSINYLAFITYTEFVLCAVRTECVSTIEVKLSL